MNANIDEYKSKLMIVEQALLVTQSQSEINDLLSLKDNLIELIALTSTSETTAEIEENKYGLDRFLCEISEKACGNVECLDEEGKLEKLKEKCEKIVGEKCSAPYRHTWGAVIYYNAIISEIESISWDNHNTKIKFKVLFINPTLREMLPCKYYLEGNCRFEEKNCYFSHGESVFASDLKEYVVPDFARLSPNCIVLAKLASRIWSRGRVLHVDFTEKKCRVRLEGTEKIQKEEDFEFQDLLPISQDEEISSDSCSDLETECKNHTSSIIYSKMPSSLFTYDTTDRLGDWEKYTKGIGSKLMTKMGYIAGNGLGINGGGIITPISAQILPPRRSLDHCMALREAAIGDKDLFSVEKKLMKLKKKQSILNTKAYERECQRVDIFSFLNKSILSDPNTVTSPTQKTQNSRNSLQQYSTKSLNVKSIGIANDIKRKQQEIAAMKKSLIRNINCVQVRSNLQRQLHNKTQELCALMNEESFLSKEQAARKTKEKFCVF